jgi:hypothetical protein
MEVKKFSEEVQQELSEMKKIGMNVPDGAFERAKNLEEMEDLMNMGISECADLLIDLS